MVICFRSALVYKCSVPNTIYMPMPFVHILKGQLMAVGLVCSVYTMFGVFGGGGGGETFLSIIQNLEIMLGHFRW